VPTPLNFSALCTPDMRHCMTDNTSFIWPICGHWTAQTTICSTTRYGASSSNEFTSRSSTTSMNWSNACSAFHLGTDNSISNNAVDERRDHFDHAYRQIMDTAQRVRQYPFIRMTCNVSFASHWYDLARGSKLLGPDQTRPMDHPRWIKSRRAFKFVSCIKHP